MTVLPPLLLLASRAKPDDLHPSSISIQGVNKITKQRDRTGAQTLVCPLSIGLESVGADSGGIPSEDAIGFSVGFDVQDKTSIAVIEIHQVRGCAETLVVVGLGFALLPDSS